MAEDPKKTADAANESIARLQQTVAKLQSVGAAFSRQMGDAASALKGFGGESEKAGDSTRNTTKTFEEEAASLQVLDRALNSSKQAFNNLNQTLRALKADSLLPFTESLSIVSDSIGDAITSSRQLDISLHRNAEGQKVSALSFMKGKDSIKDFTGVLNLAGTVVSTFNASYAATTKILDATGASAWMQNSKAVRGLNDSLIGLVSSTQNASKAARDAAASDAAWATANEKLTPALIAAARAASERRAAIQGNVEATMQAGKQDIEYARSVVPQGTAATKAQAEAIGRLTDEVRKLESERNKLNAVEGAAKNLSLIASKEDEANAIRSKIAVMREAFNEQKIYNAAIEAGIQTKEADGKTDRNLEQVKAELSRRLSGTTAEAKKFAAAIKEAGGLMKDDASAAAQQLLNKLGALRAAGADDAAVMEQMGGELASWVKSVQIGGDVVAGTSAQVMQLANALKVQGTEAQKAADATKKMADEQAAALSSLGVETGDAMEKQAQSILTGIQALENAGQTTEQILQRVTPNIQEYIQKLGDSVGATGQAAEGLRDFANAHGIAIQQTSKAVDAMNQEADAARSATSAKGSLADSENEAADGADSLGRAASMSADAIGRQQQAADRGGQSLSDYSAANLEWVRSGGYNSPQPGPPMERSAPAPPRESGMSASELRNMLNGILRSMMGGFD